MSATLEDLIAPKVTQVHYYSDGNETVLNVKHKRITGPVQAGLGEVVDDYRRKIAKVSGEADRIRAAIEVATTDKEKLKLTDQMVKLTTQVPDLRDMELAYLVIDPDIIFEGKPLEPTVENFARLPRALVQTLQTEIQLTTVPEKKSLVNSSNGTPAAASAVSGQVG